MQRLELLNHNHIHKQSKLVDIVNKKEVEKRDRQLEQQRLDQVVSPIEAARRASEQMLKDKNKEL